MKKSILISIVLVISFFIAVPVAQAQINRKIFGLEIGKSTEYQTKRMLKNKGYKYDIMPDGSYAVSLNNVQYGGGYWTYVDFSFCQGVLYEIYFQNNIVEAPMNIDKMYDLLSNSLNNKYKQYKESSSAYSSEIEKSEYFFDRKTVVNLTLFTPGYKKHISLRYTDFSLYNKKQQLIDSEL